MTFNASCSLSRARLCVGMAGELFTTTAVDDAALVQARVAALLDVVEARLSDVVEAAEPDADQRAHIAARLLSHTGRMLADLHFANWDAGETVAALVSAAAAEMDALARALERVNEPSAGGATA